MLPETIRRTVLEYQDISKELKDAYEFLTDAQRYVVDVVLEMAQNNEKGMYYVNAPAGSGKTQVICVAARAINELLSFRPVGGEHFNEDKPFPCAPVGIAAFTNRGVQVSEDRYHSLFNCNDVAVTTINKWTRSQPKENEELLRAYTKRQKEIDKILEKDPNHTEREELETELKEVNRQINKLTEFVDGASVPFDHIPVGTLLIDEGSMMSVRMTGRVASYRCLHIVFFDHAQLPMPVDKSEPATEPFVLYQKPQLRLTQIFRQGNDESGLSRLLLDVRDGEAGSVRHYTGDGSVIYKGHTMFNMPKLKNCVPLWNGKRDDYLVGLFWSNESRRMFNARVRIDAGFMYQAGGRYEGLFPREGELIIFRGNRSPLYRDFTEEEAAAEQRRVEEAKRLGLEYEQRHGVQREINKGQIVNVVSNAERNDEGDYEVQIKLPYDRMPFTVRLNPNPFRNYWHGPVGGRKLWWPLKEARSEAHPEQYFEEYYLFDYAYGLTVYGAQGGEWDYVIFDQASTMTKNNDLAPRMGYTACSRARKALIFIGPFVRFPKEPILEGENEDNPLDTWLDLEPSAAREERIPRF